MEERTGSDAVCEWRETTPDSSSAWTWWRWRTYSHTLWFESSGAAVAAVVHTAQFKAWVHFQFISPEDWFDFLLSLYFTWKSPEMYYNFFKGNLMKSHHFLSKTDEGNLVHHNIKATPMNIFTSTKDQMTHVAPSNRHTENDHQLCSSPPLYRAF